MKQVCQSCNSNADMEIMLDRVQEYHRTDGQSHDTGSEASFDE